MSWIISREYFLSYFISGSSESSVGSCSQIEGDLFQIHVYDLYREEEIQKQMEMLSAELFSKIGVDNLIIQFWTGAQMIE
mgnify:FL=1